MAHAVTPSDVVDAAAICRRVLAPVTDRDWSVRAGDLDWDVRATLIHACDAVGWYAAHLAVQARHRLRVDLRVHDDATNAEVLDVLEATAATLALVARAAPPDARAYHSAGMADVIGFVAMGCDEVLVHGWDACRGLGLGLVAPPDLAGRRARATVPVGAPRRRSLARAAVGERTCRPRRRSPAARVGLGMALRTGRRVGRDDPEMERFVARTLRVGRRGRALAAGVAMTCCQPVLAGWTWLRPMTWGSTPTCRCGARSSSRPRRRSWPGSGSQGTPRVLDIGAGPGSLVSSILDVAPTAQVVALDASIEMLRAAADRTAARGMNGDALALPIGAATVDAVLCTFVLFHLSDPSQAIAEAARVLRTGGRLGTVTWGREGATKASAVWEEAFADAGDRPVAAAACGHGPGQPRRHRRPAPWRWSGAAADLARDAHAPMGAVHVLAARDGHRREPGPAPARRTRTAGPGSSPRCGPDWMRSTWTTSSGGARSSAPSPANRAEERRRAGASGRRGGFLIASGRYGQWVDRSAVLLGGDDPGERSEEVRDDRCRITVRGGRADRRRDRGPGRAPVRGHDRELGDRVRPPRPRVGPVPGAGRRRQRVTCGARRPDGHGRAVRARVARAAGGGRVPDRRRPGRRRRRTPLRSAHRPPGGARRRAGSATSWPRSRPS